MPADFSVIMSRGVQDGIALGQYFRQVGADADRNFQAQFLIGQTELETAISLGKLHRDNERQNFQRHLEERRLAIAEREQNRLDERFGTSSAPSTFIEDTLGLGLGAGGYEPAMDWGAGVDMETVPDVEVIPEPDAVVPTDDELFGEGFALGAGEASPEQEERDAERAEALARGDRNPIYSPEGGGRFIESASGGPDPAGLLGSGSESREMEAMETELGAGTQLGAGPQLGVAGAAQQDLEHRSDAELIAIMGKSKLRMGGPATQDTRAASALYTMTVEEAQRRERELRTRKAGETKVATEARRAKAEAFRDEVREATRERRAAATEKDTTEVRNLTKVFNSRKEDAVAIYNGNQNDSKVSFDPDIRKEMETAYSSTQSDYVEGPLPGSYAAMEPEGKKIWSKVVDARTKFWKTVHDMDTAADKLGIDTKETIQGLETPATPIAAPVVAAPAAPNAGSWLNRTLKNTRK